MAFTRSPLKDHHPQLFDVLNWMERVLACNPEFFRQAIREWSDAPRRPRIIPASGRHRQMSDLVKRVLLAVVYDCLAEQGSPRFNPWVNDPIGTELPYAVALIGVIGSQGLDDIQVRYVLEAFRDVRAKYDKTNSLAKRKLKTAVRPAHRPPDTDEVRDARWGDLWLAGTYRTQMQFSEFLREPLSDVHEALDRDRKRRREIWSARSKSRLKK